MQPIITIFCAFTRDWAVEQWLTDLGRLDYPPELMNLCFIVDCDEPMIAGNLMSFGQNNGYRSSKTIINGDWAPNEVRIAVRRKRIAEVKNQSKELIEQCDGDIIVSFEDDTVFPDLDLDRLIRPMRDNESVGFVEGVQCGRWGVKMIGAWSVDDYEFPQRAETLLPGKGYQEIDAGGWYGYATRRDLYLQCDYAWDNEPWGPDVTWGLWLRNRGYKCLVDWSTIFGHNDHGRIGWPDTNLAKVIYTKDPANGEWRRHHDDENRSS